jgi:hypothetical protein
LAARSEKSVCYTLYVDDLGRKSTLIKVKDLLHKRLLLNRTYLYVDWLYLTAREDTS